MNCTKIIYQTGLLTFLLMLILGPLQGQTKEQTTSGNSPKLTPDPAVPWADLAEGSAALIRIDLQQLNFPTTTVGRLQAAMENQGYDFLSDTNLLRENYDRIRQEVGNRSLFLAIDLPTSMNQSLIRVLIRDEAESIENSELFSQYGLEFKRQANGWLVAGVDDSRADNTAASSFFPCSQETLGLFMQAFQHCNNDPIQIMIVPPTYLWRTYEEIMPELPKQFGGGPTKRLTQGMKWTTINLDPDTLQFTMTIGSETPAAAEEFSQMAPKMISALAEQLALWLPLGRTQELCEKINTKAEGNLVVWREIEGSFLDQLIQKFSGVAGQTLETAKDQKVKNMLKQLALGVHNYESAFLCFPPAAKFRDAKGESGLSWRVHLLPFFDENDLYQQFKLDEPWDSPHNKKLIPLMPACFQPRSNQSGPDQNPIPAGHTTLLAPVGEATIFGGPKPVRFRDILDGTSNTIMLVEVKTEFAVPWTSPQDYRFEPANPAKGLRLNKEGKFLAAMADGSVQEIPGGLPPASIESLFQMNDGKMIQID